jgi:hypothetical protein
LLALPLLSSCEKRLFHFIVTIDQTAPFVIDQTGSFNQTVPITEQDILRALDVPETGTITGVDIESLSLRVAVKDGNQATALNVSGTITEGGQTKSMFTNFPVTLVAVNAPFIGLNALIEDGISSLRRKINGYVKGIDNSSFQITVSGTTVPANARALFDVNLKIKATVKYDECLEVPFGSSGDDCPSAE